MEVCSNLTANMSAVSPSCKAAADKYDKTINRGNT
jgi:hypothetical protein